MLVRLDWRKKLASFCWLIKDPRFYGFRKLRNLDVFIPKLVLVLSFFGHDSLELPCQIILLIHQLLTVLSLSRLLDFQLVLQFFDLLG